jgi:LemA protein
MSKGLIITLSVLGGLLLVVILTIGWGVGIYNNIVAKDQGVKSAWSQVENQYQRRYDLIPNLVETVKGFAKQEKEVLIGFKKRRMD